MMKNVYSVGQVNTYIKNMFAQDFMLQRISVKGEVSNCKYHTSGHIYFTIKDAAGTLNAVMFAGSRKGLKFQMKEGDQVVVTGSVEVYERDGKYQIYAREIELDGAGKILYPALVQGDGAVESIVNGIHALDALGVDVMIVGRGGGSIEDLWAFNEEEVARAIFECETPVISAVGHETDWTIADFVADLRAPTPSAAAELAVFDYAAVEGRLGEIKERMFLLNMQRIQQMRKELEHAKDRLSYLSPEGQLREKRKYAADLEEQLRNRMEHMIELRRHKLALLSERLEGVSPVKKLAQGYSYVTDENGHTLTDAEGVKAGDRVKIRLLKGALEAEVTEVLHER